MTVIETQIVETWRIHNRITIFTIENIPAEAFNATLSTRGGRDVSRQLAHMHNVRAWQLEAFAKKSSLPLAAFGKEESPSKEKLTQAFTQSGLTMEKYIEHCIINKEGAATNFKKGIVPMLGYYISHEAHHRGNILLTMKQCGFKIPDNLKWDIWDWNKI